MRAVCFGAPQPRWFAISQKKYKRADLAGGGRFWAGTRTVVQYDIMGLPLCSLSMFFLGLGSWVLTLTWSNVRILLISMYKRISTHICIYSILSRGPGLMKTQLHRRCKDLQSSQGLWLVTVTDYIQWRLGLFTRITCTVSWFSTEILSMHGWKQKQSQFFFMKKLGVDAKVSDSSVWLLPLFYGETGCTMHQQVSDSSGWLMLMHFLKFKKSRYQSSQRASKWELGCAMLEIPAPLRALLFHHPQRIQNIVSMAPRAKTVSLWATAWSHPPRCNHRPQWAKHTKSRRCDWSHQSNETKCAWACLRWRQWLTVATVESICFSSWRGISFAMLRAVPSRGPAASMWCHPTDNEYELHRAHWNNPSNSMELHAVSSQSHTWNNHCYRHAKIFFDDIQVASGLQAAKQHTCPFCGLANKATIHRTRSYGWEAVIVLLDDFIQGRPWSSVIVRILDVFLPGLRPLQHLTLRHGWAYLRTLVSFTWEKSCQIVLMRTHSSCGVKHMEGTRQSSWIRQIFWATQVRNADLLSRMETQTVLVASHAKLAKRNNST